MIRVQRGGEPPKLAKERSRRLAALGREWLANEVDPTDPDAVARFIDANETRIEDGYGIARAELRARLHNKCAYCEKTIGKRDPLDHFRPRRPRRVGRGDGRTLEHPGYWWLAFSWDNLLPSCVDCNSIKDNVFVVEGRRICPWSADIEGEKAALLDPSRIDPTRHLKFHLDSRGHWTAQGKTTLGKTSAAALELDRPGDRYDVHLGQLAELVTSIEAAALRGAEDLRATWRRKVEVYVVRAAAAFRALTRAYLHHHLGDLLARHDLELPRLADERPPTPIEPLFCPRPELDGLEQELELRIRGLGASPRVEDTRTLLIALAATKDWTLEELAAIFTFSLNAVAKHVRALVKERRLELDRGVVRAQIR